MSKAARTRQHIVEKTAPLFNKKGFDGTSLSDLTAATGLTKGALYGHFKDKEDLALAAFKYAIGRIREEARLFLAEGTSYRAQLALLVDFYAEYVFRPPVEGGCVLLNTAVEVDDHRPGMRRVVLEELSGTINFITGLIESGISNGEFRPDTNARSMAYVFFCSVEGALMYARVEQSEEPMRIIVNHCKNIIQQISL